MLRIRSFHLLALLALLSMPAYAAPLHLDMVRIVDDVRPGLLSVGDGIAAPGEVLTLQISVTNQGASESGPAVATIEAIYPEQATVIDATVALAPIAANGQAIPASFFRVQLARGLPFQTVVPLRVSIEESGVGAWTFMHNLQLLPSVGSQPVAGNGLGASYLVQDASANRVYVSNTFSGTVSVIDPQVGSTVAMLDIGEEAAWLDVDESGKRLFVTDISAKTVEVFSTESYARVASVTLAYEPTWLEFDSQRRRLYIATTRKNQGGTPIEARIEILDMATMVLGTPITSIGKNIIHISCDEEDEVLYIVDGSDRKIIIYDLVDGTSTPTDLKAQTSAFYAKVAFLDDQKDLFCVGLKRSNGAYAIAKFEGQTYQGLFDFADEGLDSLEGMAWDPNGERMFINGRFDTLGSRVLALAFTVDSITQEAKWRIGGKHLQATYVEAADAVYLVNNLKCRADLINASTLTIGRSIWLGNVIGAVAVDPNRNIFYSANKDTDTVSVINGNGHRVIRTFAVGDTPYDLLPLPARNRLLVSLYSEHQVAVIDTHRMRVITKIDLRSTPAEDKRPQFIRQNPNTGRVYITNYWSNDVSVLSATDFSLLKTVPVGIYSRPTGIAINAVSDEIYITDSYNSAIAVMDGQTDTIDSSIFLDIGVYPQILAYDSVNDTILATYLSDFPTPPKDILVVRNGAIAQRVQLPEFVLGLQVDEANRCFYAVGGQIGKLYKICLDTFQVISTHDVGRVPPILPIRPMGALATNPRTGLLYCSPPGAGKLAVLQTREVPQPTGANILSVTGDSQALITWSPVKDAAGYHVYRSRREAGPYTRLSYSTLPAVVNEFMDPTVVNGITYYFKIGAIGEDGSEGPLSPPYGPFIPTSGSEKDFKFSSIQEAIHLQMEETAKGLLTLKGLNGFKGPVSLRCNEEIEGVTATLSQTTVRLPAAVRLVVSADSKVLPDVYYIEIEATGAGSTKTLALFVRVIEPVIDIMAETAVETPNSVLRVGPQVILTSDTTGSTEEDLDAVTIKGKFVGLEEISSCDLEVSKPDGTKESVRNILLANGEFGQDFAVENETQFGVWKAVVSWTGGPDGLPRSSQELDVPVFKAEKTISGIRLEQQHGYGDNAIVVLGGASGSEVPSDSIDLMTSTAYETMLNRRYSDESMTVLSSTNSEGWDREPTEQNLAQAVSSGIQSGTFALYMIGEVENGEFILNASETLTAQEMNSMLASQTGAGASVLIMDAPDAGSFLDELSDEGRAVVLSTHPGGSAHLNQTWRAFSTYFFQQIAAGMNVRDSVSVTADVLTAFSPVFPDQIPQSSFLPESLGDLKLGSMFTPANAVEIQDVLPPVVLDLSSSMVLEPSSFYTIETQVVDEHAIDSVTAVIEMPDGSFASATLVDEGEEYRLQSGPYNEVGTYVVSVIAQDVYGNISEPVSTSFTVLAGDFDGNSVVDEMDLFAATAHWYTSTPDYDGTGEMDSGDLLSIIKSSQQ